tara:strand:+ start:17209 stop:18369 length:1161 start_codon:yes stop_codon:yes gene_type:complete
VTLPSGKRIRVNGTTPKGTPNTKKATEQAERIRILEVTDPALAQRRREELTSETRSPIPTVSEYIKSYLDVIATDGKPRGRESKERILKKDIEPEFGRLRLDEILQRHVDAFKVKLLTGIKATKKTKGRSPLEAKTVNNYLAPLGALMRNAVKNKVIQDCDLDLTCVFAMAEIAPLSDAKFEALLAACTDQRYRVGLLLSRDAGLRVGEIRALRWCDISTKNNALTVRLAFDTKGRLGTPKSNKQRGVPLSARLMDELEKLMPQARAEWSGNGWILTKLKDDESLSYWAVRDKILDLYREAGVDKPRLPWHCLRHAFCTELAEAGIAIHTIKELAGHASIETTLRYMHTNEEAKQAAIAKAFSGGKCRKSAEIFEPKRENPSKSLD